VSANKNDAGKPDLTLLPRSALEGVARVRAHGNKKYGRDNWRGGMEWTRLLAAAFRHMYAWLEGENRDPESGESVLDHAICSLMFLSAYEKQGLGTDDRPAPMVVERSDRCPGVGPDGDRCVQAPGHPGVCHFEVV